MVFSIEMLFSAPHNRWQDYKLDSDQDSLTLSKDKVCHTRSILNVLAIHKGLY